MDKKNFDDRWLYIPIIVLAIYLFIRLVDQSKIISIFPLDKYNDWSSYMSQLHFLKVCGFHNFCSYWYNGFINLQISQPGWYFFIYPLYLITNNVQLTAYLSLILTLLLSFIAIYFSRNKLNLSKIKVIAVFLFFFANAISIGNFIRLGKVHEFFGWFNLIAIFIFLLIYKDKKIDYKFLFIIPFYFFAILSHQNSALISSLAIVGLILIKDLREKLKVIYISLIPIILTSFWWLDYIKNFFNTTSKTILVSNTLTSINQATYNDNIVATIIPIIFFASLYFYLRSINNRKKEFLFLLPQSIIAFLLLTRLIIFVPFMNHVFPDSYALFLLFFTILMIFKIDFSIFKNYKKFIPIILVLVSLASVTLNIIFTPSFIEHTVLEKNTLSVLENVEEKFMILNTPSRRTSYPEAYYSYAAIYLNLSTPSGWYPSMVSKDYINKLSLPETYLKNRDCSSLKESLYGLEAKEIISYDDYCKVLADCEFEQRMNKDNVCLYKIK